MGLTYKITYKKGIENRVADALSRVQTQHNPEILAVSLLQPVWLQELVDSYSSDPPTSKFLATLAIQGSSDDFTLQQGVIKFRGRIWIGNNSAIQLKIM